MPTPIVHYCRFEGSDGPQYGKISGDQIDILTGNFLNGGVPTGQSVPLAGTRLLAPVTPGKIIAVGLNYRSHIGDRPTPTVPGLFIKMPNTLIGPGDPVPLPADAENVQNEGELVLVIGRRTKNVSPESAGDSIFGLTCGHDVSARVWQRGDLQWVRAKSSDGFGPVGPYVATGLDPNDLLLRARRNGTVEQEERTSQFVFPPHEVIAYISRTITLEIGDIIFTGTPGATPRIAPGDTIEVEIEGIGTLTNPVVAAEV